MANRRLYQFHEKYEAKTVQIFMNVSIGSTGAPTLVSNKNKGITSITRNAAGKYTVVLQDNFARLMDLSIVSKNATGISAAPGLGIIADNVAAAAKSVQFQMANLSGVATDPASGDVLLIKMTLKNSSI